MLFWFFYFVERLDDVVLSDCYIALSNAFPHHFSDHKMSACKAGVVGLLHSNTNSV